MKEQQHNFIKMQGEIGTYHVLHNRNIEIENIDNLNQQLDKDLEVIYVFEIKKAKFSLDVISGLFYRYDIDLK